MGTGSVEDENVDNKLHEYTTSSAEIKISNKQYQKVLNFVKYSQNNPPVYNLLAGAQRSIWAYRAKQQGIKPKITTILTAMPLT